MNVAAASVMSVSAAPPPILNKIRKTRAFFRKLSLNAEKNWHQNSGAKRRDSISGFVSGVGLAMGRPYASCLGAWGMVSRVPGRTDIASLPTIWGGHHEHGGCGAGKRRR